MTAEARIAPDPHIARDPLRVSSPPAVASAAPGETPPAAASRAAPLLLGALVGSLVAARWETALGCLVLSLAIGAGLRAPRPGRAFFSTLVVGGSLALVFNLLLVPGRTLAVLPFGIHATAEGLDRGIVLALRLAGAALAVHGLRALWPGERGADELARLARPLERLGVPVRASRMMAGLALRFVPLLAAESRRIAALQSHRFGRPPRNLAERIARRRAAMVPTMVAALERADRVALALEARGYRERPLPPRASTAWGWRLLGLSIAGLALAWRR